ncbi:MAG: type II toxin-antitoxin system prevent-host-death family antitoxin [Bacillota bacterium]
MEKIGAYDAKTHLPRLLEQVKEGAEIIITKHGVPVAVLKPYQPEKQVDTRTVIDGLYELREKSTLEGISIRELIEEGRK